MVIILRRQFLFTCLLGLQLCSAETSSIFSEPAKLCDLLSVEGFSKGPWQASGPGYACTSTNFRIDYIVTGDEQRRAKRLKLVLDLKYQAGDIAERRAEFSRVATRLLGQLGLKASPALRNAIISTLQFRDVQASANITFDPGRRPFLKQTLTVRDPSIRVVTIPRSPFVSAH